MSSPSAITDVCLLQRDATGRPSAWSTLVEALREVRRAIEPGKVIGVAADASLLDAPSDKGPPLLLSLHGLRAS